MPWYLGIDENGLGPQLGPLIVTAVLARVSEDAERALATDPRVFLHERLDDSKKLVDHRHVALGEAWARVLGDASDGEPPGLLVERLVLEGMEVLQTPCPRSSKPQCWSAAGETFAAGTDKLAQARQDLARLRRLGIDALWTRCSVTCVKRIHDGYGKGLGRLDLDLHAMEALIVAARRRAGDDIVARCGKVGGLMRYTPKFSVLSGHLPVMLEEQPAESAYRVAGIGRVHFLRDAEERDPLVSLASLVGKWMREVLMGRIVRYYQRLDANLPDASGYNDPVTHRFVRETASLRRSLGIVDSCFLRPIAAKK
ncbi:MAG: hypothetical protein ACOC1F_14035 [Myxococcota bacterium]